jgi:putative methyltransferase (TIGR04325 family)
MTPITDLYPDYASAAAACGEGYSDEDIAKVAAFKTAHYAAQQGLVPQLEQSLNTMLAVGIAAGNIAERPLHVLDFGGACGFHYVAAARSFQTPMRWAIVEKPPMVKHARETAGNRFETYETISEGASALGRVDLVHASGAVQYVPAPLASIDDLVRLRSRYIILSRFPIWNERECVGVQSSHLSRNGLGPMAPGIADRVIRYPVTFLNADEVLAKFAPSYDPIVTLSAPSGSYVINGKAAAGATFVFRLK